MGKLTFCCTACLSVPVMKAQKQGGTDPYLTHNAVAEHFRRHVRDCASGLGLHTADQIQVACKSKVRDLGAEAMRIGRARRQQDVACITASQ